MFVVRAGVFGLLLALVGCSPSAEQRLLQRVERATEPSRFAFTHTAAVSAAAGCVRPFLRFRGIVDYDRRLLVVTDYDQRDEMIMVMNDDQALLSASLFKGVAQPWVRIPRPVPNALVAVVERALGPDLAPYVTAGDLPPSGIATVAQALEVASSVRALRGRDDFRVAVNTASGFGEITAIDTRIDTHGRVLSVTVLPDTSPSDSGRGGWTVAYDDVSERPIIAPPDGAVDGERVDGLEVRPLPCELAQ